MTSGQCTCCTGARPATRGGRTRACLQSADTAGRVVPGAKEHVREADERCWAVRHASSERVGLGGEELVQVAQPFPLLRSGLLQQRAGLFGAHVREHCGEVVHDAGQDLPCRLTAVLPDGHGLPGLRIVVRRTAGGSARAPPWATRRICSLATSTSMRSFGVQPRMSHRAARVSIDRRCGGWVTSR